MLFLVVTLLIALLITTSRHVTGGRTNSKSTFNKDNAAKPKNNFSKTFDTHTSGAVIEIESAAHYRSLISDKKDLIVIDFYSHTCAPCKVLSPYLDKFAVQYVDKGVKFGKVNCVRLGEVVMENSVTGMPTVVFFKKGAELHRIVGCDILGIRKFLEKHS